MNTFTVKVRKDGAVNIPKAVRRRLDVRHRDLAVCHIDENNTLAISFEDHTCPCCGTHNPAPISIGGVYICEDCNQKLLAKIRRGRSVDGALSAISRDKRRAV